MKKLFVTALAVAAAGAFSLPAQESAPSTVKSQVFPGEYVQSFSANGKWMVSEADGGSGIIIRNLETGETWPYINDGTETGMTFEKGYGICISDDGVAIAERQGIPCYWQKGRWTNLPGTGLGAAAIVGAITPDGSVIVGGLSNQSSFWTKPVVWYRLETGAYSEPEYLPNPVRNSLGNGSMYVQCNSVSFDGKTVGVTYTSGNGFYHLPYVYIKNDDGTWTNKALGDNLFNPRGSMPTPPADYRGSFPNYENYMTPEQIDEFYKASEAWAKDLYEQGLIEDEITVAQFSFAMEFMDEDQRQKYLPELNAFLARVTPWLEQWKEYLKEMADFEENSIDFLFNNVFVSPDGKYVYATGYRSVLVDPTDPEYGMVDFHGPVRFDVATGESTVYGFDEDVVITGVLADYSVLAQEYDLDPYFYREAYIYPGLSTEGITISEYFRQEGNEDAYLWLEDHLLQEVPVADANWNITYDDRWCMGKPIATPDMSLIAFGTSTWYWTMLPDEDAVFFTYLLNPAEEYSNDMDSVGSVTENAESVCVLAGSRIEVKGDVASLNVYDLSGARVFSVANPGEVTETGLQPGIYILTATLRDGNRITLKATF